MEAVNLSDMTCEEALDICILKTHELLSKAQLLMFDIEELLDLCTSTGPANQRRCRTIQQECQASSMEEDGETLVIEGFRFESAVSREDLRRLRPQAGGGGGGRHLSDGYLSGFITESQQGQMTGRGNSGRRRANK